MIDRHNTSVLIQTLQHQAQRAAEERLAACTEMLWHEEEGGDLYDRDHPEWDDISAPYCGCDTCIAREVLDAAWPFMSALALVVEQADTSDSNSDAERHAGSNPAKGTHSDYERVKMLESLIEDMYLRVFR